MIGDFRNLPDLARWFLQSTLDSKDIPTYDSGGGPSLFSTQGIVANDLVQEIEKFEEDQKECTRFLILSGQTGNGKSTILQNVLRRVQSNTFKRERMLFVSIKDHTSVDSFYSLCSKLAREFDMRKDSAALEEFEGNAERKDIAVINVLKKFQLICLDDIDEDGGEMFQFLSQILKSMDQPMTVVCSCVSAQKVCLGVQRKRVFSVQPMNHKEAVHLFNIAFKFDMEPPLPEFYFDLASGTASDVIVLTNILNYHGDVDYLAKYKMMLSNKALESPFLAIMNSELDCLSKHLLAQLCKIRRPIPVQDTECFDKLIRFGLALTVTKNGYQFLSVSSSIRKRYQHLLTHEDYIVSNYKMYSALELWKETLSPKLKQVIQDCQTENWIFVPESWNSVKDVGSSERYNVNDLINKANMVDPSLKEYDVILECLYHAILEKDYSQSVALIFLVDRYTFWTGTCKAALAVLEYIESQSPETPIPPQIVIRKARVLKNDGNIQEAVKVLDLVINSKESIGSYRYNSVDDSKHVTALCVSIKGDILRGLSLWKDAAKTLIKSIELTNALQRTEKKIISGAKAHLADTFRYMSLEDYEDVAKQLNLVTGHPLREAIRFATEAAQLCMFTPLFYLKNKRRAGNLSLIIARMLPNNEQKYEYLENAAHEFREGLRCHDSISRLESKDQFYEFVLAVQRLSVICREKVVIQSIGDNIGVTLEKLAKLLYEHHCLFPQQIKHNKYSKTLINLTLSLMDLPEIPEDDDLEMIDTHVPLVEVKPSLIVQSLPKMRDELVQEISDIINVSNSHLTNLAEINAGESKSTSEKLVGFKNRSTIASSTESKQEIPDLRNATTLLGSKSAEDADKSGRLEDAIENKGQPKGVLGMISRAISTHSSTELTHGSDCSTLSNIRDRTTIQSVEEKKDCLDGNGNLRSVQESIRSLRTASTTVDLCYATAEDESIVERGARVKGTINTLEASDKMAVNWKAVESLHAGIRMPTDVHRALQWLYDPRTHLWAASETLVYVGEKLQLGKKEGACRDAFNFEFLEQDDPLRKYIGKQYRLEKYKDRPKLEKQYKQDIVSQSLSRYYATLFNKALYQCRDGRTIGQVQFLPAVFIEILDVANGPEKFYNVEPFIAGDFVKISNNFSWIVQGDIPGKELLMAFSHFSYWSSQGKLIIVDIQGWMSNEKEGQTYLTDPQIHTIDRKGFGTGNRGEAGFQKFWTEQHVSCTSICKMLELDKHRPGFALP